MSGSDKFKDHLVRRIKWEDIDESYLRHLIETARAEDIEGAGLKILPKIAADITTQTLTPETKANVCLVARRDMVVCGLKLAKLVLKVYEGFSSSEASCELKALAKDGDKVLAGTKLAEISGSGRVVLQAERIMLNFLQRLSGIATETAKYVEAMKSSPSMLLDTRKTTPGLRVLEKYAFACGGGFNHRMGLFDRVMLKDNHLACSGAANGEMLANAVKFAKTKNPNFAVEVEVDEISQIQPVLDAEADVIMLDNFSLLQIEEAMSIIGNKAWVEISGGVNLQSITQIAALKPDFISTAAPIHSSNWIDIGLDA